MREWVPHCAELMGRRCNGRPNNSLILFKPCRLVRSFNQRVVGSIPTGLTIEGHIEGHELFWPLARPETGYRVNSCAGAGPQVRQRGGMWPRILKTTIFTQRRNLNFWRPVACARSIWIAGFSSKLFISLCLDRCGSVSLASLRDWRRTFIAALSLMA